MTKYKLMSCGKVIQRLQNKIATQNQLNYEDDYEKARLKTENYEYERKQTLCL